MSLIELFNDVDVYDVIVENDGKQYHLMSKLLKKHSPFFSKELDKIEIKQDPMMISSNSQSKLFLSGKKIIKLDQYQLNNEAVIKVLRNMYGEQLTITKDNAIDFLKIGTLFEMIKILNECSKFLEENIKLDTLLNDLTEAALSKSLLMPVYHRAFMVKILMFERDDVLRLMTGLPIESLLEILSSDELACPEDYVFDIVDHITKAMVLPDCLNDCLKLMSCVRLSLLSETKLLEKAKVHPFVDKYKYIEALEFNIRPNDDFVSRSCIVFAIGKMNEQYDGYRIVTNNEIQNKIFLYLFKKTYLLQGIYCLDNFNNGREKQLSTSTHLIKMNDYLVRPIKDDIMKGQFVRLYSKLDNGLIDNKINQMIGHEIINPNSIGLYIPKNMTF